MGRREAADYPGVVKQLEGSLTDLARHHHAAYQRHGEEQHFELAVQWYRHYLKHFDGTPPAQAMHFLLAELLFEHEDYAQAVVHYEHSAYAFEADENASTAGYAALLAYHRHGRDLDGDAAEAWERRELDSAGRFSQRFPDHPQTPNVLARVIDRRFQLGDHDIADAAARRLLEHYPDTAPRLQLTAWSVLGHIRFERQAYPAAETAYEEALALPELPSERAAPLQEALAATIYRHAEQLREEGEVTAAVEEFLRVPESEVQAIAEYDAASLLLSHQRWEQAAEVLDRFRTQRPDHELTPEVSRRLAVAYREAGAAGLAAAEFSRIANASDDEDIRQDALQEAGELYREAGDYEKEQAALVAYVDAFPAPLDQNLEARRRLIELYAADNDARQVRAQREAIIAADRDAGEQRTPRSRYLAAHARLALADEARAAFMAIELSNPLESSLARKEQRMEEALAAYEQAADYRVAQVTTAATYRTAEIYAHLAKALLESERPPGLDAAALDEYELLLEEQAYPFEEQAIELHELNIARTRRGVFDQWVRQSYDALAQLMPARYRKPERSVHVIETLD
ncbi:tetratricopeptide repeat protein [Alkalilimnicola ehrlichii]|uniref:tetratricopeptide repeat protein n=1 Tax=Alkalilimnicola ehrlichii TaxID=351052 RepID=UPI0015F29205|nr:tetratricopeptide repeat protein [Alkalilimnicola ehrlichii]